MNIPSKFLSRENFIIVIISFNVRLYSNISRNAVIVK